MIKPMNAQEREEMLRKLQETLDWFKGIKKEKERK